MGEEYLFCPQYIYTITIFHVICIFGAISQILLLYAFAKDPIKCFRNSGTYLIANLAIADLLTCLQVPVFCFLPTTWKFLSWASEGVSTFTISSIALDRFLLVAYPLKHRVLMSGKLVVVFSTCIWLICSAVLAKAFYYSERSVMNSIIIGMNLLQVTQIVLACLIYGFTYHKLKKQSTGFALENVPELQRQTRIMKEKQFLTTIIIVACIAFVCVVPASIFYHLTALQKVYTFRQAAEILDDIFSVLFYINFAVNPLLYAIRLPNYRKTFYLLYCCKGQRRR